MVGITSSTIRMVVSSRQVASAAWPVLVRVVTPLTTEMTPPTSSTGVTPPRMSTSISLSPYRAVRPLSPRSSAPPRGTAGSVSPAMAPATAAARVPAPSEAAGPTSTMRSALRTPARAASWVAFSEEGPSTTAMRSRRSWEAVSTLCRRAWCTVASVLSQVITAMSSSCSSSAKAAV